MSTVWDGLSAADAGRVVGCSTTAFAVELAPRPPPVARRTRPHRRRRHHGPAAHCSGGSMSTRSATDRMAAQRFPTDEDLERIAPRIDREHRLRRPARRAAARRRRPCSRAAAPFARAARLRRRDSHDDRDRRRRAGHAAAGHPRCSPPGCGITQAADAATLLALARRLRPGPHLRSRTAGSTTSTSSGGDPASTKAAPARSSPRWRPGTEGRRRLRPQGVEGAALHIHDRCGSE